MNNKYNVNDTAFLIESNLTIREVKIVKFAGGLYTIRFVKGGGGIKVRESRLFATKEEAESALPNPKTKPTPHRSTPWEWPH